MLGIMHALESWQHYLEGAKVQFEIWTDHHNLQYFMEAKKLNWWQACWALYLSRFDFNLVHKPGPTMGKADALSRRTDHKEGIEHDNENVVLLKPKFFKVHVLSQGYLLIEGHEESILTKIRKSKDIQRPWWVSCKSSGRVEEIINQAVAIRRMVRRAGTCII